MTFRGDGKDLQASIVFFDASLMHVNPLRVHGDPWPICIIAPTVYNVLQSIIYGIKNDVFKILSPAGWVLPNHQSENRKIVLNSIQLFLKLG